MRILSYAVSPGSVLIVTDDGVPHTVTSGHANYGRIVQLLKEFGDRADVAALLSPAAAIPAWSDGRAEVRDGTIVVNGREPDDPALVDHILDLQQGGHDFDRYVKFAESLDRNPSRNSRLQLFDFIRRNGLTLLPDGRLLAYKSVRPDLKDWHTGAVDNRPGTKPPRMERREVDDNPAHHCSHGYHVGAFEYASTFGGEDRRIVLCAVAAEDVVSVPNDEACRKVRVVGYEVLREVTGQPKVDAPAAADVRRYEVTMRDDKDTDERTYVVEVDVEDEPDPIAAAQTLAIGEWGGDDTLNWWDPSDPPQMRVVSIRQL